MSRCRKLKRSVGFRRRLHALVRRGAPHGHGGLAEFVHTPLGPKLSLPLRIVERLTQYQGDKALGVHRTQRLHQGTKAAYTDFGIGTHRFISRTKAVGSISVMSCTSCRRLRMSSSVVTKYGHAPAMAHAMCKASFAFSPMPASLLALLKNHGGFLDIHRRILPPSADRRAPLLERIGSILEIQHVGPDEFQRPTTDMLLDTQRGFCFQPHAHLSLVIKRTIEATVVEVHSHIGLLIRIMRRILSARIKKIRLTPRILISICGRSR